MILNQYYLGGLAQASYLVGDEGGGVAAVIDPRRDVQQYIDDAATLGCRIGHVVLTHFHADFVAGHLELRERTGAEIHLGARANAEYRFTPMPDGSVLRLGGVRLEVLETPGHSPESISILVYEPGGEAPYAVLTGDTLFIGDVGRPDLRASLGWSADQLASMLYDSVQGKLAPLPDATLVYPGHGAGSLCGKNLSSETVSTIGAQRLSNYALAPIDRARFVELVSADLPDAPAYFSYDAALNTRERPTIERALERGLRALAIEKVLELGRDGAQLLDTRDPQRFQNAYLAGSVNVGLDGSFEIWCGTLLEPETPIVLVAEPGSEAESVTRLGRIGFDQVAGYLEDGAGSLAGAAPELVQRIEQITALALAERLGRADPPAVVDVRTAAEFEASRIDGAINMPLADLPASLATLARDRPVVVYCEAGYRSAIAASLIRGAGVEAVASLAGGLTAWNPADQYGSVSV